MIFKANKNNKAIKKNSDFPDGLFMTIVIKGFLMFHVLESFSVKPLTSCGKQDAFANFHLYVRKNIDFKIFFESFWHLIINQVFEVLVCLGRQQIIFGEI